MVKDMARELKRDAALRLIKKANPILFDIIRDWNPSSKEYKIIKIDYPFGVDVIDKGELQIPLDDGSVASIYDKRISPYLRKQLTYRNVPLGLVAENGQEVYHISEDRITSLAFFEPGILLGLWEALEPPDAFAPKSTWSVSSGARSLYMVPKISQLNAHQRLRKHYAFKSPPPKALNAHHNIFKQIAHSNNFSSGWKHTILFFSPEWLEEDIDNPHWLRFHRYLLSEAWELSGYHRNKVSYDHIWQLFTYHLEEIGLNSTPYMIATLRQLIGIGVGALPGFRPVSDTTISGPINKLQSAYVDIYGMKIHLPTIMAPAKFSPLNSSAPIYYSLQVPSFFDLLPRVKNQFSLMYELRELKSLTEVFIAQAMSGKLNINQTPIKRLVDNVAFDFFHSNQDIYGEIQRTSEMARSDARLLELSKCIHRSKKGVFAENGPFVRACVRLSLIEE